MAPCSTNADGREPAKKGNYDPWTDEIVPQHGADHDQVKQPSSSSNIRQPDTKEGGQKEDLKPPKRQKQLPSPGHAKKPTRKTTEEKLDCGDKQEDTCKASQPLPDRDSQGPGASVTSAPQSKRAKKDNGGQKRAEPNESRTAKQRSDSDAGLGRDNGAKPAGEQRSEGKVSKAESVTKKQSKQKPAAEKSSEKKVSDAEPATNKQSKKKEWNNSSSQQPLQQQNSEQGCDSQNKQKQRDMIIELEDTLPQPANTEQPTMPAKKGSKNEERSTSKSEEQCKTTAAKPAEVPEKSKATPQAKNKQQPGSSKRVAKDKSLDAKHNTAEHPDTSQRPAKKPKPDNATSQLNTEQQVSTNSSKEPQAPVRGNTVQWSWWGHGWWFHQGGQWKEWDGKTQVEPNSNNTQEALAQAALNRQPTAEALTTAPSASELDDEAARAMAPAKLQKCRNQYMKFLRSVTGKSAPQEIRKMALAARARKDQLVMSDLYEQFFLSAGDWKKSKTYKQLSHSSRSRRSVKRIWKTRAQLMKQFSDDDSLVDELMRVKKEAGAWRYHPEFPENKALIQVKVYDEEAEVEESEDEQMDGMRLEDGSDCDSSSAGDEGSDHEGSGDPADARASAGSSKPTSRSKKNVKKKKPNKKKSKQAKQGNENDPEGPPKKQLSVDAQKKKALQAIATSLSECATWSKRLTDSSSQVQEHLAMALVADMDKPTSVLKALRDELEKAAEDNQVTDLLRKIAEQQELHKASLKAMKKHVPAKKKAAEE